MAETLDPVVEICCKGIIALFIGTGVIALFIWAVLHGFEPPTCTLNHLDIPTNSSSASFTLAFTNMRHKDTGVYYDPINLTFSDNSNRSFNATVPGFHLRGGRTAKKSGMFKTEGNNSVVRVDLKTQIRYGIVFWKTKRHGLEVGADVSLDGDGSLVRKKGFLGMKKGVKLTSGAGPLDCPGILFGALLLGAYPFLLPR